MSAISARSRNPMAVVTSMLSRRGTRLVWIENGCFDLTHRCAMELGLTPLGSPARSAPSQTNRTSGGIAASCCFTLGAERSRVCNSIQVATCKCLHGCD